MNNKSQMFDRIFGILIFLLRRIMGLLGDFGGRSKSLLIQFWCILGRFFELFLRDVFRLDFS